MGERGRGSVEKEEEEAEEEEAEEEEEEEEEELGRSVRWDVAASTRDATMS